MEKHGQGQVIIWCLRLAVSSRLVWSPLPRSEIHRGYVPTVFICPMLRATRTVTQVPVDTYPHYQKTGVLHKQQYCSIPYQHTLVYREPYGRHSQLILTGTQGSASILPVTLSLRREDSVLFPLPTCGYLVKQPWESAASTSAAREILLFILIALLPLTLSSSLIWQFSSYLLFPSHHSLSNYQFSISLIQLILHPFSVVIGNVACAVVSCYICIFGLVLYCHISGFHGLSPYEKADC